MQAVLRNLGLNALGHMGAHDYRDVSPCSGRRSLHGGHLFARVRTRLAKLIGHLCCPERFLAESPIFAIAARFEKVGARAQLSRRRVSEDSSVAVPADDAPWPLTRQGRPMWTPSLGPSTSCPSLSGGGGVVVSREFHTLCVL